MGKILNRPLRCFSGSLMFVLVLFASLWMIGCGEKTVPIEPETFQEELQSAETDPEVKAAMDVQERHENELLGRPGVVGAGVGSDEHGRPAVVVFVKDKKSLAEAAFLPKAIESIPVISIVTGEFKALAFDPTAKHRPAPNGVSLGHPNITAGTLGCLVQRSGTTLILSNNHVMADENNASIGDNILQPGAFDGGQNPADKIAELAAFKKIDFSGGNNIIDAAVAIVDPGDVTGATEPAGYGKPREQTRRASVNMRVRKYGRTTSQTDGTVVAINATVNVGYDSGVARFVRQIVISPGSFSAGGDSGSLIVVAGGRHDRKPVGLLFAGSATTTIANPINNVLRHFRVTIVGD